jgi:SAM-dependent methyltransferase
MGRPRLATVDPTQQPPVAASIGELEGRTWHYGLVAQWWLNKVARPEELAFYGGAIRRFGEPALDLGCGTGRLLVPLVAEGLDIDGSDLSEDMLAGCRQCAAAAGVDVQVWAQPMHELAAPRRYRTIYICDSFGIGGSRWNDRQALRRIHDHLEPGGALVMSTELPYDDASDWALWLPHGRDDLPRPWPDEPGRQVQPDGDVIVQWVRLAGFDPRVQRVVFEIRDQLVRDDAVVREEQRRIAIAVYFEQELRLMLELAGFSDIRFEAGYTGREASVDDTNVVVIAQRAPA